jgi:hypothetical protein
MSLPAEKTVHGVRIWKFPNGKYLQMLKILQEFPGDMLDALYPGKSAEEALAEMGDITFDKILELLPKLMVLIPDKVLDAFSAILEVDRNVIENELDPLQTVEVLQELAKINRFDELKKKLLPMLERIPILSQAMKSVTGSNKLFSGPTKTV